MRIRGLLCFIAAGIICLTEFIACNNKSKEKTDAIVSSPQQMQAKASAIIRSALDDAMKNDGRLNDSTLLRQIRLVNLLYQKEEFSPLWCKDEKWLSTGDSLHQFISRAQLLGLFPEDYHAKELDSIRQRFFNDSLSKGDRRNASLWATADMMLTDAFFSIIKDVKLGRLPQDSVTLRKDSVLSDSFYQAQWGIVKKSTSVNQLISSLEPNQIGYRLLKKGIPEFLDGASYKQFTIVPAPGRDKANFKKALQKRLYEEGFIAFDSVAADSARLVQAVKKFQEKKGITVDGRAGEGTVRMLNLTDREKFIRIAISMDKYKMLPEKMPSKYVWVNLPAFQMQLIDGDSVKISSKVICGKPMTRTPLLTSAISELITYPQWVPPPSIIMKEILPAVKKNPGYLEKKGFSLVDKDGNEVDPYSVDWSQYSKGIPYRVVQGSGDANALGIMKFVFANKYSVYLHDTNQRYLFGQTYRSLSHGCVRVQEWDKLAFYLLKNDSVVSGSRSSRTDSVKTWLRNKQKRSIALKSKMPVFIRYITCEGKRDRIVFYDDIYGDDKRLREKYFASK